MTGGMEMQSKKPINANPGSNRSIFMVQPSLTRHLDQKAFLNETSFGREYYWHKSDGIATKIAGGVIFSAGFQNFNSSLLTDNVQDIVHRNNGRNIVQLLILRFEQRLSRISAGPEGFYT